MAGPRPEHTRRTILDLADTPANVVVTGETGTGKELVARCLHEQSIRRQGQFVAINCGGVPEQLFESEMFGYEPGAFTGATRRRIGKIAWANGGTLFLDEWKASNLPSRCCACYRSARSNGWARTN